MELEGEEFSRHFSSLRIGTYKVLGLLQKAQHLWHHMYSILDGMSFRDPSTFT